MRADKDIFPYFGYVELVPKVCRHLSVTPCMGNTVSLEPSPHDSKE
jgi:hypothetical protein